MYFIQRGECQVMIAGKTGNGAMDKVRTLYAGDYFGEIAIIYDCKRSTVVQSIHYSILGKISKDKLEVLFKEFPFFKQKLKERINTYDDDLKLFLECALKTIDYMQGVPDETITEIIFSVEYAKFDKGSKIFEKDEIANVLWLIEGGMVEIYTQMDRGVEFVIERLYRGSVINHRSFITEDKIDINARCFMPVTLFFIKLDKMKEIMQACPKLQKNVDEVEIMLINRDNPIALDYIISRNPRLLPKRKKLPL